MLLERITDLACQASEAAFGIRPETIPLEPSADKGFGDLTINAFLLARQLRRPPDAIASELASRLGRQGPVRSAQAVKGYVNLRIQPQELMDSLLPAVLEADGDFGSSRQRAGKRLMVEFSAPNTNKPQHLGHMRNNFLGDSLSRILKNAGADVLKANLYNDRGIQICKSMLAYTLWGEGETPKTSGQKGDHFVGRFYVRFEQELKAQRDHFMDGHPEHYAEWKAAHSRGRGGRVLDEEALQKAYGNSFREENFGVLELGRRCQEMLRQWEARDPQVLELWKTMNRWAIEGFEATYRRLGVSFDRIYRESETYRQGKELIQQGLEKGIFYRRDDGAIEGDFSRQKLGKKVVQRSDQTSLYITQDIATTVKKAQENKLDGQIWVVAEEQEYHFQVLFEILRRFEYPWAQDLYHLAYGLVHLPEGRMKSREGKVVDADDLLDEVRNLAAREIESRDPEGRIPKEEVMRRAEAIGLASLRFMLLKVAPMSSMIFNPAASVRFEGDTGARILYVYARLKSMLVQARARKTAAPADWKLLTHERETDLALRMLFYPRVCSRAALLCNPSQICGFLLELARELNRFYEQCPVLHARTPGLRQARLQLCRAAALVIRHACGLLGMPLLEKM